MHMITLDKVLFLNDYLDSFPIELCCDEVTRRGFNYVSCANTYLVKKNFISRSNTERDTYSSQYG